MGDTYDRKKRVRRLKKVILGTVASAVVIPVIACVILTVYVFRLKGEVRELRTLLAVKQETDEVTGIFTTARIEESPRESSDGKQAVIKEEMPAYEKQVYLTFDDGPSSNTDAILDILKQYDIKATFFVVGKTDEKSRELYKRIVAEGHTLGMHSYSHKYGEIYASRESFAADLQKLQEYLYEVTGVWSRYYRFPGGSSNTVSKVDMQELIAYLSDSGITYFDWNTASGDAVSGTLSGESILKNCTSKLDGQKECMILLHDAAEKKTTLESLPQIIESILARGDAEFLPVTDDTAPIQHISGKK